MIYNQLPTGNYDIPSINFSDRRDKSGYQTLETLQWTLHISKHPSVNTLWNSSDICSFTCVYPASISQATQITNTVLLSWDAASLPSCTSAWRSGGPCSVCAHFTRTQAGPVPILTSWSLGRSCGASRLTCGSAWPGFGCCFLHPKSANFHAAFLFISRADYFFVSKVTLQFPGYCLTLLMVAFLFIRVILVKRHPRQFCISQARRWCCLWQAVWAFQW